MFSLVQLWCWEWCHGFGWSSNWWTENWQVYRQARVLIRQVYRQSHQANVQNVCETDCWRHWRDEKVVHCCLTRWVWSFKFYYLLLLTDLNWMDKSNIFIGLILGFQEQNNKIPINIVSFLLMYNQCCPILQKQLKSIIKSIVSWLKQNFVLKIIYVILTEPEIQPGYVQY